MAEQAMANQTTTNSNQNNNRNDRGGRGGMGGANGRPGMGGRGGHQGQGGQGRFMMEREPQEFEEKVVQVSRVSKKTKGGNQMGFSILVVVGDKKGRVGVGLGKGKDVVSSIKKGVKKAKKNLITVPMDGTTIPFRVEVKKGAAQVLLKPAPKGSGVIAGGPVRAVVEAAGIRDLSSKILGTGNQASNVYATFEALNEIKKMVELKGLKLKSIADIEKEEEAKLAALQEKAKESASEAENDKAKKEVMVKKAGKNEGKRTNDTKKAPVKTEAGATKKAEAKADSKKTEAEATKPKADKKVEKK